MSVVEGVGSRRLLARAVNPPTTVATRLCKSGVAPGPGLTLVLL